MEGEAGAASPLLQMRTHLAYRVYARLLSPRLTPGARLLDVGPAAGTIRLWLPRSVTYVGLDPCPHDLVWMISPHFVRMGFARRPVVYLRGVGEHIPFETRTFDIALCTSALDHAQDPGRVLREIARVLKPGGIVLAGAPMEDLYEHRGRLSQAWRALVDAHDPLWVIHRVVGEVRRFGTAGAPRGEEVPHPCPMDAKALVRLMARTGFRTLKTGAINSVFWVLAAVDT